MNRKEITKYLLKETDLTSKFLKSLNDIDLDGLFGIIVKNRKKGV